MNTNDRTSRKKNIKKCERSGLELKNIPRNERTRELCEIAVKKTSEALIYVPKEFVDVDMCTLAVYKKNRIYEKGLEFVPEAFLEDVIFRINKDKILHGKKFRNIPKKEKTKKLCEFAVEFDYKNIEFVPNKFRTKKLIAIAVASSIKALDYIAGDDEEILDLYVMAAKKTAKSYYYMPLKIAYEARQIIKNERDRMEYEKTKAANEWIEENVWEEDEENLSTDLEM